MAKIGDTNVPLLPTVILIAGGYIAWFAVHYWQDTTQTYPSGPLKALLTGKGLPAPAKEDKSAEQLTTAQALGQAASPIGSIGGTVIASGAAAGVGSTVNPSSGVANQTSFTPSQVGQLWESVGGDPGQTSFAVGVVQAESGGDATVTSSNPDGGTNVGLYQLDTKGVGAGHSVAELQDPVTNTQITVLATANGTNWSEWADPWISAHGTRGNLQ